MSRQRRFRIGSPPETIETERLRLRRPFEEDAEEIFEAWARDPEVTRYLVWRPHQSVAETRAFLFRCKFRWEEAREFVWVFEERSTGRLVGSLAARPGAHGVDVGYLMARDRWGHGMMTEVLTSVCPWWLSQEGVYRVWATCDVENRASARVLEKACFSLEGTLRRWDRHPNLGEEPRDALCFSRVRSSRQG